MRLLSVLVALQVFTIQLLSQVYEGKVYVGTEPTKKQKLEWNKEIAGKIKATTTLVALDGESPEIMQSFIEAMSMFWTKTDYKFIKTSEVNKFISNPQYSLIIPLNTSYTSSDKALGHFMVFILGNSRYKDLQDLEWQMDIKLPSKKVNNKEVLLDYTYLTSFIVRRFDKELTDWENGVLEQSQEIYKLEKEGLEEINKKTIFICKNDLPSDFDYDTFQKKIKKNLKNADQKAKIVSPEEIKKAIDTKDETVVVVDLFLSTTRRKGGYGNGYSAATMKFLGGVSSY